MGVAVGVWDAVGVEVAVGVGVGVSVGVAEGGAVAVAVGWGVGVPPLPAPPSVGEGSQVRGRQEARKAPREVSRSLRKSRRERLSSFIAAPERENES